MLGFEKDYPGAERILLGTNYRSRKPIVDAAGRLIVHNKTRFSKEIRAARGAGREVDLRVFKDQGEENLTIARELADYASMGIPYRDMAVIYRTNAGPRLLISKLMEYNIPFRMRDSLPNLYDHWISKNILAYIRAARGDRSRRNLLTIVNRPVRYISREALESEQVDWERVKAFYQDKAWMLERIEQLEYDLRVLKNMAPAGAVNYIRKAVGYDDFLKEYARERKIQEEDLFQVLDSLQESAADFTDFEAWSAHMDAYREQLATQRQKKEEQADGVNLMTMHSSKGLEFQVVYILDANEGITPHHKAVLDPELEEERRMFYVAMTRAKERLHIFYVRERCHKKQTISRFAQEAMRCGD